MDRAEHPHCSIAPELTFAASGLCLLVKKKGKYWTQIKNNKHHKTNRIWDKIGHADIPSCSRKQHAQTERCSRAAARAE